MRIVAVVPMKLSNERLPGKNTKKFWNGEALCQYILHTLLQVKQIDEVYAYCSNSDICNFLPKNVKYRKRDEKFDLDSSVMNEILEAFSNEVFADIYVMAHVTAPFIRKESIESGINAVLSENYDSAFTVKKMQEFIWRDGKPWNYELEKIPRTQDLAPFYIETSGFYIYTKETIQKLNRRIGIQPAMIEVGEIEAIDIDEEEDFIIADAVFNYKREA